MINDKNIRHEIWDRIAFHQNEMCRALEKADSLQGDHEDAYREALTTWYGALRAYGAIIELVKAIGCEDLIGGDDPLREADNAS